jgi:TonB family protein
MILQALVFLKDQLQRLSHIMIVNFITLGHYKPYQSMKSKIVIVSAFFLLFGLNSFSQIKKVTLLKFNGHEVSDLDSADYSRVISEPDSGSTLYNVNENYRDKTKKLIGKTSKPDAVVLEGLCLTFFPSGKKENVANFQNGKKVGDEYAYFPNGKLNVHRTYVHGENNSGDRTLIMDCRDSTGKVFAENGNGVYEGFDHDFKKIIEEGPLKDGSKTGTWKGDVGDNGKFVEEYTDGNLKTGRFTDEHNQIYTYTIRESQPQFPGGLQGFGQYLGNNIKYPYMASANRTKGKVIVAFVVATDGSLTDVRAIESPSAMLSQEAVRVVQNSPKWTPGVQFGRKVRVTYSVPIQFAFN